MCNLFYIIFVRTIVCLFECFNVRQHTWAIQTMTAREGYRLRRLRIANEIQCTHSSYTITQKGLKNASWHATNRFQLICLTCLFIMLAPLPPQSQIPHSQQSVRQSTHMNTALCYDIYSANCTVNIPSLVPRATAYASTGDNRYNCAPHREG